MATPEEIRKVPRPKNTVIKNSQINPLYQGQQFKEFNILFC